MWAHNLDQLIHANKIILVHEYQIELFLSGYSWALFSITLELKLIKVIACKEKRMYLHYQFLLDS